jgi:cytochrome c556
MRHACLLFAAVFAAAAPAMAQDLETDVVYARQILMSEIEAQMAPLDLAAVGDDFVLADSQVRASAVSAMLGVTPYLFPEGTDDDATASADFPSTALKAVWDNSAGFKAMADQSATLAFDLSQITDEADFRTKAAELRALCNACHATFMAPYDSPY